MEMHLPALASTCYVTNEPFVEDERVISHLVRQISDGEIVRCDVKGESEDRFETPGPVVCRWVQAFKPKETKENPERDLKMTADNLFMTLADPAVEELSVEDTRLVQFLALMLERKRLLKPKGRNADGSREVYEHRGSKGRYEVPVGELNPEFFIAVQAQLSVLVGGGDETPSAAEAKGEANEDPGRAPGVPET